MNNKENRFFDACRIVLSKELDVPPDDVDLMPIIECAKRAIVENCKSDDYNGPVLNPQKGEEQGAVFGPHGSFIVNKMFSGEAPFYDWAQLYEEKYIRHFLEELSGRIGDY